MECQFDVSSTPRGISDEAKRFAEAMTIWNEGMVIRVDAWSESWAIRNNLDRLGREEAGQPPLIFAALTLLVFTYLSVGGKVLLASLRDGWVLLMLGFWGLATFIWVYLEPRHLVPFFLLGWMGTFALIRVPNTVQSRRVLVSVLLPIVVVFCLPLARQTVREVRAIATGRSYGTEFKAHVLWEVADGLHRMGVEPRDRVAVLGNNGNYHAYWARLARVTIVAEVPDEEAFWRLDTQQRGMVLQVLATHARVDVARGIPTEHEAKWRRVGSTDYYMYRYMYRPRDLRPGPKNGSGALRQFRVRHG